MAIIEARIRATADIEKALNKISIPLSIVCQGNGRAPSRKSGPALPAKYTTGWCRVSPASISNWNSLRNFLRKNPKASLATIRESKAQLKLAIQEARQVIFNLRPLHYDKMELIPALTNYLKSYETQYQINTAFSVTGDEAILFPAPKSFFFGSCKRR